MVGGEVTWSLFFFLFSHTNTPTSSSSSIQALLTPQLSTAGSRALLRPGAVAAPSCELLFISLCCLFCFVFFATFFTHNVSESEIAAVRFTSGSSTFSGASGGRESSSHRPGETRALCFRYFFTFCFSTRGALCFCKSDPLTHLLLHHHPVS